MMNIADLVGTVWFPVEDPDGEEFLVSTNGQTLTLDEIITLVRDLDALTKEEGNTK